MTLSFRPFLDHALSQDCALCGVRARALLCAGCEADLPRAPALACLQCAAVCAPASPAGARCGQCLADPPFFDATRVAYRYEFPLDKLMQAYKFRAHLALAEVFARALAERLEQAPVAATLLVPLPMSAERLASRGFDQTALIATALARMLPTMRLERRLARVRNTPPQAGLDRAARLKNVRGAFACGAGLAGQQVVILDDVMTTGATLSEAARTLKQAGALGVTALAVARADHGGPPARIGRP